MSLLESVREYIDEEFKLQKEKSEAQTSSLDKKIEDIEEEKMIRLLIEHINYEWLLEYNSQNGIPLKKLLNDAVKEKRNRFNDNTPSI